MNKRCLITGATSGIGRATALELGRLGWDLWLVGRDARRGAGIVRAVDALGAGGRTRFLQVDLSSLGAVRELAATVRRETDTLDVLVNNAGARNLELVRTVDGIERTFAVNHLSHFLLTLLLLDPLLKGGAGRVVTVASGTHSSGRGDFDTVLRAAPFDGRQAYAESKLANVLFTRELARRLSAARRGDGAPSEPGTRHLAPGTRIPELGTPDQSLLTSAATALTANALDPGGVATRFALNNGLTAWARHLAYYVKSGTLLTALRGCRTVVYLATSDAVSGTTGGYFVESKPTEPSAVARDPKVAADLWRLSLDLAQVRREEVPEAMAERSVGDGR